MIPPRAILFDVDGTLLDTRRLRLEAWRRALSPYLYREPAAAEIAERQGADGPWLSRWIGERYAGDCAAAMRRGCAELYAAFTDGPYDGVREMLGALRSAGYPLAVVPGMGRDAWSAAERDLPPEAFAVVVTGDDVAAAKPDPEGLLAAARALGVPPAACLYVGDAPGDLAAGRAAGMRVAAALWGRTAPGGRERFVNEAAPCRPDWMPERPADLTRALAAWC